MPKSWERLPSSPHWQPQLRECGKGLDRLHGAGGNREQAACWKTFCLRNLVNKGSPLRWNPHLVYCSHFFFFFKICQMINSPRGTVVEPLLSHGDVSEYPDVWHQGKNNHVMDWVCYSSSWCFDNTSTTTSVAGPKMLRLYLKFWARKSWLLKG